jgi:hypothetical protein
LVTKEMFMDIDIVGQHPHILDKFRGYSLGEDETEDSCLMAAGRTIKAIFDAGDDGKYVANLVDWILSKDDIHEYAEVMRYMRSMVVTYPSRSIITLCYFDAIDEPDRWNGKQHHVVKFASIYDSVLLALFSRLPHFTWGNIKEAAGERDEDEMKRLAKIAGFTHMDSIEHEMRT